MRSSLPPKTLAGFVLAIVAVLLISFLSYRSLEERSKNAQRVTQTLQTTRELESLLSLLKDAETGQRGFLLTGAERYLVPYESAVIALPREIETVRRATFEDQRQGERINVVEQMAAAKMNELKETIDLRRAGRTEAALAIVTDDRGKEAMDAVRAAIGEMIRAEQTQLEERTREWNRSASFSANVTWGGSALLLFLVIAAAVMSSRDFHTQEMQGWVRKGQNELGSAIQGEQSVLKLGDSVAAFLARYLDAQVAAVYFAEHDRELKLTGTWGMAHGDAKTKAGLTEQAVKENRLLHVTDVPDDYVAISSGLGAKKPRHLVVAPVTSDGSANGAVELGFFRNVTEHELDLIRQVSDTIGIAFRSAKYRATLQNLLEETQRQAEELQTQQEELRVSNEELEQQTQTLEEQARSLKKQRDDLSVAQKELERASAYKSQFLANMSHELRTPLNSSLILAKLLMDNREGNLNGEQVKFAQTIYTAGNDLLTLINDILDLSRIEAGKLDVRPETIQLARFADELANGFQPIARDKALAFSVTVDERTPRSMTTDNTRLSQILRNLLSNALKFTESGGVSLSVRPQGDMIVFDVKDTGIGIAPQQHEVIFEAFRQADGTTNRKYGGTGLGLSISRDLARLLGGDLTVDSAPGRGSTFTLRMPIAYHGPNAAPLPPPVHVHHAPPKRSSDRPVPSTHHREERAEVVSGGRTILIIEDDLAFADVLKDLAHELDFKVLSAATAAQGLELAEKHRPSAIVLDVGLPDRSGLSVLDALKHSPTTRHIPVHMMSVSDYTQTALEMGALGYGLKPVKRDELVSAFHRLEAKFTQKLRRILVVEDDAVHRESTCRLLASDGVEAVSVGTASEALEQLASGSFDCMVLDLSLPDRSGFELLEDMTSKEDQPFPPVIVYTGRSLTREEETKLRRFSSSIIIKGARSPERLLDEVTLFLHQVETELPADRQRMLKTARHREAVFEGRRVLVVEDDARNIFALTSVLEPRGATVEIARNGREAIDHLQKSPGVDLVLMDIMMPEMDGLEATREIRKRPELAKLPIIALTAKAMADDRDNCLIAGANDYIAKPLDVDKLLSLARVWMPK